jgi:hypothetical protein
LHSGIHKQFKKTFQAHSRAFFRRISMTTMTRLLKTKLAITLALGLTISLIAASAVYFSTSSVSANDKRNDAKAKTVKTAKSSVKTSGKSKSKQTTTQAQSQSQLSPVGGGAALDLLTANPVQEFFDQWGDQGDWQFGTSADAKARKHHVKKADEPDKAIQYFLKKRLPEGETELPVEKYFEAQEAMQQMEVFSTAENRLLSREELKSSPEQPRLGTWTPLGPGNIGGRTRTIIINPNDPNTMFAAGVAGGIWKTTNAGASWTPIADLIANIAVTCLAFDPKNANTIYAGTGEGFFQRGRSSRSRHFQIH